MRKQIVLEMSEAVRTSLSVTTIDIKLGIPLVQILDPILALFTCLVTLP